VKHVREVRKNVRDVIMVSVATDFDMMTYVSGLVFSSLVLSCGSPSIAPMASQPRKPRLETYFSIIFKRFYL
jgi:hypothetical protein